MTPTMKVTDINDAREWVKTSPEQQARFERARDAVAEMAEAERTRDKHIHVIDLLLEALLVWRAKLMAVGPHSEARERDMRAELEELDLVHAEGGAAWSQRMDLLHRARVREGDIRAARRPVENAIYRMREAFSETYEPKPDDAGYAVFLADAIRYCADRVRSTVPAFALTLPQAVADVLSSIRQSRRDLDTVATKNAPTLAAAIIALAKVGKGRKARGGVTRDEADTALAKFMGAIGLGTTADGMKKKRQRVQEKEAKRRLLTPPK
jgi:hypothetical protein